MSNHHLSIVRDIKNLKGPQRAVLIVLADRADDTGTCYPGMGKIAKESGFCRSTVKTALRSLKEAGLISWKQRQNEDGELTSNLYTLALPRAGDALPRAGDALPLGQELTYPRAGAGHKASIKTSTEASLLAELIYEEYPRKAAMKNGIKAILKAMKENDPDFLLERTKAYAAAIGWQERRFIPHPATWFNGESFNDDPAEWKQPAINGAKPKPQKAHEYRL